MTMNEQKKIEIPLSGFQFGILLFVIGSIFSVIKIGLDGWRLFFSQFDPVNTLASIMVCVDMIILFIAVVINIGTFLEKHFSFKRENRHE